MVKKERKLYKIGHLTKLLGITHRTIRYYDQMGLLPHVKRSHGNVRLFDEEDYEILKKIKLLQKNEFLPLEEIRNRLFGEKKGKAEAKAVVLTDSSASIPKEIIDSLPIEIIPISTTIETNSQKSQGTTEATFLDTFETLSKKGINKIYAIHISSSLSETFEIAKATAEKAGTDLEIIPIDSRSSGSGLGLFVQLIAEAIQEKSTSNEIDLLISKQRRLIYTIGCMNGFKNLLTKNDTVLSILQKKLLENLNTFNPIFVMKDESGDVQVIDCQQEIDKTFSIIFDTLEEEIQTRGGYVSRIMVMYNYLYSESHELINKLKSKYPNTEIYLEKDPSLLSQFLSPEAMTISII